MEDCRKISIWNLRKEGYIGCIKSGIMTWFRGEKESASISIYVDSIPDIERENYIRFKYTQTEYDTGDKKDFDYKLSLIPTKCNFGGERYWFLCYCGYLAGVLYKTPDSDYFRCRHCQNLTYESRNANRRSGVFTYMQIMNQSEKINEIKKTIKRHSYRGRLTRKQKRIEVLYDKYGSRLFI